MYLDETTGEKNWKWQRRKSTGPNRTGNRPSFGSKGKRSTDSGKKRTRPFDSLEQEFLNQTITTGDSILGSGEEDDMITLDLEPVSPKPQLVEVCDTYDNEEERNVFVVSISAAAIRVINEIFMHHQSIIVFYECAP